MTKEVFESLKERDQLKQVNALAVPLAERFMRGNRVFLFAIDSFYVEIIYELSNINNNTLRIYRVLTNINDLDDYVEQIDISELNLT